MQAQILSINDGYRVLCVFILGSYKASDKLLNGDSFTAIAKSSKIISGTELEEPSQLKRAVIDASAGAVAGAVSRMVTSPLDVIKIRFQVQLEPIASWVLTNNDFPLRPNYNGLFPTTKDL